MYQRPPAAVLRNRLSEAPRRIQIVAGPRQVGKSTLVKAVLGERDPDSSTYRSADPGEKAIEVSSRVALNQRELERAPAVSDARWLEHQWQIAHERARI